MHLLTVLRSIGDILFEKVCENIAKNDYLGHLDHGSLGHHTKIDICIVSIEKTHTRSKIDIHIMSIIEIMQVEV